MNRREMIAGTLAAGALAGLPGGAVANETLERLNALGFSEIIPSGSIDWNSPTGFRSDNLRGANRVKCWSLPAGLA